MLRITRVDIVDDWTLDIELSNGHVILFDTRRLMEADPIFDGRRSLEVLPRPGTDGQSIFWEGGPRLLLGEIMTLLNQQNDQDVSEI